ncbi:MAG: YIP1 family protein [Gaiellaceae bacterium MAG52_C11]|nr:YIP1 family protein [Candidatus Gaiellasilicea maunaloa]
MSSDRQWWLRVPAVFLSPGSVFAALRNEEQEDVDARQEPILALVYLAGIAAVLGTSTAGSLLDDGEYDSLLVAVWAVIAGGIYGLAGYFIIGGALYLGARGLGSLGTYRRARHLLGFAAAPLALSLLFVWPVELAVLGSDVFRTGGSDDGTADLVFDGLELGFALWSAALLLLGVRAVHGWSWWRSLGVMGLVALFLAAFAYLPSVL